MPTHTETPTETAQTYFENARQNAIREKKFGKNREEAILTTLELQCLANWHLCVGLRATYQAVQELKQELRRQR